MTYAELEAAGWIEKRAKWGARKKQVPRVKKTDPKSRNGGKGKGRGTKSKGKRFNSLDDTKSTMANAKKRDDIKNMDVRKASSMRSLASRNLPKDYQTHKQRWLQLDEGQENLYLTPVY